MIVNIGWPQDEQTSAFLLHHLGKQRREEHRLSRCTSLSLRLNPHRYGCTEDLALHQLPPVEIHGGGAVRTGSCPIRCREERGQLVKTNQKTDLSVQFCSIIPKQDPNEDTEWNDVLRKFGILPPKEKPKDKTEEMVLCLQKEAEGKFKLQIHAIRITKFETPMQQRLQEWKCLQKRQKYGELREISGEQYVKEVTNAPEDVWVIIHLYWSRGRWKARVYLKVEELEWKLAEVGAIESDLEENPKKDIINMMTLSMQNISVHQKINTKSSDVLKPHIT
ncbi:phosducin-like protein 2 [Cyrtonyx montezumae]|uniref:phosducin-like protein 2 n=1 Tax=Cyrtonyx montezumae TaxID=9017 RepID=UPI0032DA4769